MTIPVGWTALNEDIQAEIQRMCNPDYLTEHGQIVLLKDGGTRAVTKSGESFKNGALVAAREAR
jgi:hypothetical protein